MSSSSHVTIQFMSSSIHSLKMFNKHNKDKRRRPTPNQSPKSKTSKAINEVAPSYPQATRQSNLFFPTVYPSIRIRKTVNQKTTGGQFIIHNSIIIKLKHSRIHAQQIYIPNIPNTLTPHEYYPPTPYTSCYHNSIIAQQAYSISNQVINMGSSLNNISHINHINSCLINSTNTIHHFKAYANESSLSKESPNRIYIYNSHLITITKIISSNRFTKCIRTSK